MSNDFINELDATENEEKHEYNTLDLLEDIFANMDDSGNIKSVESTNKKWLNQILNNTTEDSVNESPVESSKSEEKSEFTSANNSKEEELFNDSVNEKIPEKAQDHANEENVKNNKEAEVKKNVDIDLEAKNNEEEKEIENKKYKKNLEYDTQKVNQISLLKRIGQGIMKAVKKVVYVAVAPIRWTGDRITEIMMPKESRAKLYNEAIDRAKAEMDKKREDATKENGYTIAKKIEILNDEKKNDREKLLALSKLCYDTNRTIYVKTQEGAFKFERNGDSVLISHANPMKRTLESKATYTFRAIGGVTFDVLGGIKNKEIDIRDAEEQIRMDKGFDPHTRELEKNVILESDIITDVEKDPNQTELQNEDKINEAILSGDQKTVVKEVLNSLDNSNEKGESISEIHMVEMDGVMVDERDVEEIRALEDPELIHNVLDSIQNGSYEDKVSMIENSGCGSYTLLNSQDTSSREAVAKCAIGLHHEEFLDQLVKDPDSTVRCKVAEVGRPQDLEILKDDTSPEVNKIANEILVNSQTLAQSEIIPPAPEPDQEYLDSQVPDSPEVPPISFMPEEHSSEAMENITVEPVIEEEEIQIEVPPVKNKILTNNGLETIVEETEVVYRDTEEPIKSPFMEKLEKMTGAARGENSQKERVFTESKEEIR